MNDEFTETNRINYFHPSYIPCNGNLPCQPAHLPPHVLEERMKVGIDGKFKYKYKYKYKFKSNANPNQMQIHIKSKSKSNVNTNQMQIQM